MKQKNYNIPTVVYFVVTALLIAYFFPREGKFRYQFYEGKPWRYGLLTAPSDFPIYKTDDEVKAEKDSVLRKFEPYYRMNPGIQKEEIEKLRTNYNNDNSLRSKVSPAYMQYIQTLNTRDMAKSLQNGGCGECQTSCQSACKTSCGIANQPCEKK